MKGNFIASNFILISVLTLGIYPLVTAILVLCNLNQFQNRGLVIAAAILSILGFWIVFVPFIMGFFFKKI